jgi:PTS system fructose-specific IIC component
MAAEALKKQATLMGHQLVAYVLNPKAPVWPGPAELASADGIILATDTQLDTAPLDEFPLHVTSTAAAIRDPAGAIHAALAHASAAPAVAAPPRAASRAPGGKRIVAITSCPTGIAHTFMAAEALRRQAVAMGHIINVETQGSVGAGDVLTPEQIAAADVAIIAADTKVDLSRFTGKTLYQTDTATALKKPQAVIEAALTQEAPAARAPATGAVTGAAAPKRRLGQKPQSGPYKHLLTGVSYMLPVVVAGGLLIALSFVFGIHAFEKEGTLAAALMTIGGGTAFKLMVPVLSGYIAYSIADRPGIAPGLVGGMLAFNLGAGFIGGIFSGFLAGYVAKAIKDYVHLPKSLQGLMPVLIIPLFATGIVGLLMIYVVGEPVKYALDGLTAWLKGMNSANAVLLGVILGAMMAFDMGGPVNKAAYTFSVGLLASNTFRPMAAVMAAGMVPPLAIALATVLAPRKFITSEREANKATALLGLCFITEGAIPYVARDPLRLIPSIMVASALTGALSMLFDCQLHAPHGGVFAILIPNAVDHVALYALAIAIGTVVGALIIVAVKQTVEEEIDAEAIA